MDVFKKAKARAKKRTSRKADSLEAESGKKGNANKLNKVLIVGATAAVLLWLVSNN